MSFAKVGILKAVGTVVSVLPVVGIVFLQGCVAAKPLTVKSTVASEKNQSRSLRYIETHEVMGWRVNAAAKEPNNSSSTDVSWCSAMYTDSDDTWVMADLNTDFKMSLSFASPKWSLQENQKYQISYAFDLDEPVHVEGMAFDVDGVYFIAGSASPELFEKLMTSHNMTFTVNGTDVVFRLKYSDDAMAQMYKCMQFHSGVRIPLFERLIPDALLSADSPWPLLNTSKTDKQANPSYWEDRLDEFANDMLAHAALDDVYRVPDTSFPVAFSGLEAAWRNDTVFGAVTYAMGYIEPDSSDAFVTKFERLCEGQTVSKNERRTLPNNGVVYRAVTKCGGSKGKTSVVTQYPLSDKNAYYTLFHYSEQPGQAEAMDMRIFETIAGGIAYQMKENLK